MSVRANIDDLIQNINILNPKNEKGKIVLITRFGFENVINYLDPLVKKIKELNLNVIFICDPNHGNTKVHEISNKKVRYFDEMKTEIILTNKVLTDNSLFLSGLHLESSCFNVTECIGGLDNSIDEIKEECYTTSCDPRLNYKQVNIYY